MEQAVGGERENDLGDEDGRLVQQGDNETSLSKS